MICLEDFKSKEKVTALPCIHFFHTPCIKEWIKEKNECPVCKFELTQQNINSINPNYNFKVNPKFITVPEGIEENSFLKRLFIRLKNISNLFFDF